MPQYESPKDLRGLPLDFIPEADFILPICTNRERFMLMLEALYYFRSRTADHLNLDHMIDFLEGWAYLGNPTDSPCFPDMEVDREVNECVDYPTDAPIISYYPQNPFTQPDYIPPAYIAPPFVVVDTTDVFEDLAGYIPGDVVTGFLGIPVPAAVPGGELAHIRIKFSGKGVVELHLLKLVLGGMVLITHDDNPFTLTSLSLYKDPLQIPLELITELIIERTFETDGDHHIDLTFVPRFNDELTFVTYGGGLRSVVLCGFDKTLDQVADERAREGAISIEVEKELDMGMRIDPDRCWIIQRECSPGEWVDWYDPFCAGSGAPDVQPPGGGEVATPGDCREYDVVLRANERWRLPVPVEAGFTIQITAASGGWSDGTPNWFCPNGQIYLLGACTDIGAGTDAGDPLPALNHMRLITKIGADYFDGYNTTITVPPGVTASEVEFQANDSSLGDNSGSIAFHVKVCNAGLVREVITVLMTTWLTPPTSFNTNPDKMYKLTFSGEGYPDNPDLKGDAFYTSTDDWATHDRHANPNVCTGFLDVACDCTPFATIPPYSADHVYVVYRPGTGAPFTIIYADDFYGDNSGTLTCVVEEM